MDWLTKADSFTSSDICDFATRFPVVDTVFLKLHSMANIGTCCSIKVSLQYKEFAVFRSRLLIRRMFRLQETPRKPIYLGSLLLFRSATQSNGAQGTAICFTECRQVTQVGRSFCRSLLCSRVTVKQLGFSEAGEITRPHMNVFCTIPPSVRSDIIARHTPINSSVCRSISFCTRQYGSRSYLPKDIWEQNR